MAVVLLGGARLPRTTGPPTDLEEGIGAPVSAREGAHPNQVIGDQLLEESRQADAALQGQSLEPVELGRIESDVRRHPGHSCHNDIMVATQSGARSALHRHARPPGHHAGSREAPSSIVWSKRPASAKASATSWSTPGAYPTRRSIPR